MTMPRLSRPHAEAQREYVARQKAKDPEAWKAKRAIARQKYRAKYPDKNNAHIKVNNEVRAGRLQRPTLCERCGKKPLYMEASHSDYARPLDVEWLCEDCHTSKDWFE